VRLVPCQTAAVHGYRLTYTGITQRDTPQALETRAHLVVTGRWNGRIATGNNQYKFPPEPNQHVAIVTDWLRAEDLYVIADDIRPSGAVYFKVLVKPLVNLIWIAGIVFLIGSAVAMWPDAREQRRLVMRLAPARATA
jgi:cytochrome c biogenesis factor